MLTRKDFAHFRPSCTHLSAAAGPVGHTAIVNNERNGSLLPIFYLSCCKGCSYISTYWLLITNIISAERKKKKQKNCTEPESWNHRTMKAGKTSQIPNSNPPWLCPLTMALSATSTWALNTFRDSPTSLGSCATASALFGEEIVPNIWYALPGAALRHTYICHSHAGLNWAVRLCASWSFVELKPTTQFT